MSILKECAAFLIGKKSEMQKSEDKFLKDLQKAEQHQDRESPDNGMCIMLWIYVHVHVFHVFIGTPPPPKKRKSGAKGGKKKEKVAPPPKKPAQKRKKPGIDMFIKLV